MSESQAEERPERARLQYDSHRIIGSGQIDIEDMEQPQAAGVRWKASLLLDDVTDSSYLDQGKLGQSVEVKLQDRAGEPRQSVTVRHIDRMTVHLVCTEELPPLKPTETPDGDAPST